MRTFHDDDEWEPTYERRPCTTCNGDMRKCNGGCNGMSSYGMKRRDPVEVAKIKADRQRREEDAILARADAIRALRAHGERQDGSSK
jgi:hypothetical protein